MSHSFSSAARAPNGNYKSFIQFWDESRLNRIRDGLGALRDLCVECTGDIVKVDQLGFLIGIVAIDLASDFVGEMDGPPLSGFFMHHGNDARINRCRDGLSALRDLCVESQGDIVKVAQIGFLIETITRDLGRLVIGERDGQPDLLGEAK